MTLLKPLLYFSLFRYPLTEEELYTYSEATSKEKAKEEELGLPESVIPPANAPQEKEKELETA